MTHVSLTQGKGTQGKGTQGKGTQGKGTQGSPVMAPLPEGAAPWGDRSVDLAVADLRYRVEGLDARQAGWLQERFGIPAAPHASRPVPLQVGYRSFEDKPPEAYLSEQRCYTPLVAPVGANYRVEGLGFRGEVCLQPGPRGGLATADASRLATVMVFENYLRILTAFVALRSGGVLLHSSGVVVDGRAWLFLGRSGAGKTTMARKALAWGADILSDDANLLLPDGRGGFVAGPVPFAGELGQVPCRDNRPHPVAGLFWLQQGEGVATERLEGATALARVLACCPVVNVRPEVGAELDVVLDALLAAVPVSALTFGLGDSFAEVCRLALDPSAAVRGAGAP